MSANFKTIENNIGYSVNESDRKIFERGSLPSTFGTSKSGWDNYKSSDCIEFILKDSNDNILPQGESGELIRYIYLDDVKIRDYFQITDGVNSINGYPEYFINSELLINEAGYSLGIFKVQVTLLNRRLGLPKSKYNKGWIHEISPSRTEIRILPILNMDGELDEDIEERYRIFLDGVDFRDDILIHVNELIDGLNVESVLNSLRSLKGKVDDGESYIGLIRSEFSISSSMESMLIAIQQQFNKSIKYFVEYKNYNINAQDYGMQISGHRSLRISRSETMDVISDIFNDTIEYILPKRNIIETKSVSMEQQVTIDRLKSILKTTNSNSEYETTIPKSVKNENPKPKVNVATYWIWSSSGFMRYVDKNGNEYTWSGKQGDHLKIEFIGKISTTDDIRTTRFIVPKPEPIPPIKPFVKPSNLGWKNRREDRNGYTNRGKIEIRPSYNTRML